MQKAFCDNDVDAVVRASVLAIGDSFDKPEDDPERRIAIINDDGREIGTVHRLLQAHLRKSAPLVDGLALCSGR